MASVSSDEDPTTTPMTKMVWKKMHSSVLGIKTIIKEYTNKQGRSHLAHFTIHGKYIGSCSKLGSEPVEYEGNFRVPEDATEESLKKNL
jgi:hypothetical protein